MAAILLPGLSAIASRPSPLAGVVDYPTIQVVSRLTPRAGLDVMTSAVTAPLERQSARCRDLSRCRKARRRIGGNAASFTVPPPDAAEQEVQAAINAATNLLPPRPAELPIIAKSTRRPADYDACRHLKRDADDPCRVTW